MQKISWTDEYSVGVEKIDNQHRHLFEMINKLIEGPGASGDSEIVSETLKEMIDYARVHFTDEEVLMQRYNYPEIEKHKRQHDYFITTTAELAVSFMDNRKTTEGEIVEFLILWLTNHILKTDMKFKPLFQAKMPAGVS